MFKLPIYLDYAASTPMDSRVTAKMLDALNYSFANSSSLHFYGRQAKEMVENARSQVAAAVSAEPAEIVWTSGATEAVNLAIKGATHLYARKGNHIITARTEHKAVLDTCQYLEKNGYRVTYLTPDAEGLIDLEELRACIDETTVLVSIMHVNNETGVIQDIKKIADITSQLGVFLHVDAAQSIGKIAMNVQEIPLDMLSLCAHKTYGPKGVGALYLRRKPRVRVQPLLHGGGHEQGMRSGTLATHQIVGMGMAFEIACAEQQQDKQHITTMQQLFLQKLQKIKSFRLNCDLNQCVPHILSVRFEDLLADALLAKLPQLAASTASACQGKGGEGSYVLRAMGLTFEQVKASIRFSFGRHTTAAEIEVAAQAILNLFA